jgi:homoserine O-succinyltransferase/O-acetyltransferase
MPIILPEGLPARNALIGDDVVVTGHAAPLRVALVNLMPRKIDSEFQIARMLAASPHAVELTLVLPSGHEPKTTHGDHIRRFYRRWEEIADRSFDGLIVTGAPVEMLPFESVTYWPSLTAMFDWAHERVGQSLYICWAAQAALYHIHGIGKRALAAKAFGVYKQAVEARQHPLVRGMGPEITTPVSRHTTIDQRDIDAVADLTTIAASRATGPCLLADDRRRAAFIFNHLEYEADTLIREYRRDLAAGLDIRPPANLELKARPSHDSGVPWQRDGRLFFLNWVVAMARRRAIGEWRSACAQGDLRLAG